ncbi:hypothetical protein LCGC14_1798340 [marine sediment metagenome]|uniref:Uncharacterized protein n=1 Tax=marine sediment metagenome TaxID=412755 RepID=A0A0F9GQG1_9ZZZZ
MSVSEKLVVLRRIVDKQANDDGLWFAAKTAPEAYLQHALRMLHEIVEGKTSVERALELIVGRLDA